MQSFTARMHLLKATSALGKDAVVPINSVIYMYTVSVPSTTVKQTRSSAIAEGPRDASCQLKSCQLPRNSAETT